MDYKQPKIGTAIVILNSKGQILMGRRLYEPLGYSLPGGHLEFGETLNECGIREVREEVGVEIENVEIKTIGENLFPDKKYHSISIFIFSTIKINQTIKNPEPTNCAGWSWFDLSKIPKNLSFNYEPIFKNNASIVREYITKFNLN